MTDRIRLPSPPQNQERPSFPLLASAAPVAGALAMWAFTQSPYALLFAFLGPLVAVGGLIDSRRRHRKSARAARERYDSEVAAARESIERAHRLERVGITRAVAGALDILSKGRPTHERWRYSPPAPLTLALGTGTAPSGVAVEGAEPPGLAAHAATLTDTPVVCDARDGIGIVGSGPAAMAHFRALALQLAHAVSPDGAALQFDNPQGIVPEPDLEWLRGLPHTTTETTTASPNRQRAALTLATHDGPRLATLALAAAESGLPRECRVAIRVAGTAAHVVRWPDPDAAPTEVRPHLLARESAARLAAALGDIAVCDGIVDDRRLPAEVSVSDLGGQPPATPDRLACVFGLGAGGTPVEVDLVTEGPHALVGGTTGSGKSELLCAWVHALAATRGPNDLTVLLVDYKGGASFRTIDSLPHIVGTITDLDPAEARRALESLTAELRYRERELARAGARDITDLAQGALPRLVIVVDEYAALVAEHPALHTVFADIAARGRSLGMHLILATQRPAGIVRDNILANLPLRVSLRVLEPADSTATIGAPDAAHLPGELPGRALLVTPQRSLTPLQPALVRAQDAATLGSHRAAASPPRRPWLPQLPTAVTPRDLDDADREAASGAPDQPGPANDTNRLRFGLADRPTEQRRMVANFDLATASNLLVVGARGSGRTTALNALGGAARDIGLETTRVPTDIEGAWDAIHGVLESVRGRSPQRRLCLLDDIDLVLSRTPEDHRDALTRALTSLLAEGPARGIACALALTRLGAATSSLASHCDARLVLRTADRHDHHSAGADPQHWLSEVPPGRGWFRGDLVQVVMPSAAGSLQSPRTVPVLPRGTPVIVSPRPGELVERLAAAWGSGAAVPLTAMALTSDDDAVRAAPGGQAHPALVAHPDTWLSRFALFTELGRRAAVAYHDCSVAQFRQLSATRTLPPPLAAPADTVWLARPAAPVSRAALPAWPSRHPS